MSGSVPSIISASRRYWALNCSGSWRSTSTSVRPSTTLAASLTAMWLKESRASKLVPNM